MPVYVWLFMKKKIKTDLQNNSENNNNNISRIFYMLGLL